ncbi:thioredoxin family protein [Oceanobacillus manasiensis]|uniref:thioredoxin family protein n=1 Tax=Oceanobacillus manasiensis TaxID=586413 RepID=UPI0005A97925|nr:thioredoxin family protein [Oceanobacillus manasiensis]
MKNLETVEQFNEWKNKENVIMYFTAGWCPDCVVIEPVLPEIEEEFPAYTFIKINRDNFIEICQEHDVFGIPSFLAFSNGKETGRFVNKNRKTKEEIVEFIQGLS